MTISPAAGFAASINGSSPANQGSSDYQTFLRMLTVQMQNQDPLNPIESSDYAVQLATFSGVEQQVMTNQLLTALSSQFSMMNMSQLAGWVGQEARAAADVFYQGAAVTLSPNPAAGADRAILVVRDHQGQILAREDMPNSSAPYLWFGGDALGNPLPTGRYSLSLESYNGEALLSTTPVEYYAKITEARGSAEGTTLVFEGGIEVPSSTITALRLAQD